MTNNQNPQHCYLFALEISPLEEGAAYETLPMHCTLMHRFWVSETPEELAQKAKLILRKYQNISFTPGKKMELGPKHTVVYELEGLDELKRLHMELYGLLQSLGTTFTEDEWVGDGYTPHASDREDSPLRQDVPFTASTVNLIEVKVPGHDHMRFVRKRLALG
jgi:hypothetical protein